MVSIQEWFDNKFSKDISQIFVKDSKGEEKIEGNTLVVKDFKELRCLFLDGLPELEEITFDNCENLEFFESFINRKLKINLVGQFSKLKTFDLTSNTKVVFVNEKKEPKTICWSCFGSALLIIWNIVLTYLLFRVYQKRQKEKREKEIANGKKIK